MKAKHPLQH